jgi:hypothetical protein
VRLRRSFIAALALVCACSSASGGGDDQTGNPDGSATDAPAGDSAVDTHVDDASDAAHDVVVDTGAAIDTRPDGPCKTTCGGAECGKIDDGCGGIVDCGDCGDLPGEVCETIAPLFQTRVHNAISALASASPPPSYFDLADTSCGGGYKVTDANGFVGALVSLLATKADVVVIQDPKDGNEIRIRAATSSSAENYHVVTSAMCSAYKYTSTCTPAGF